MSNDKNLYMESGRGHNRHHHRRVRCIDGTRYLVWSTQTSLLQSIIVSFATLELANTLCFREMILSLRESLSLARSRFILRQRREPKMKFVGFAVLSAVRHWFDPIELIHLWTLAYKLNSLSCGWIVIQIIVCGHLNPLRSLQIYPNNIVSSLSMVVSSS